MSDFNLLIDEKIVPGDLMMPVVLEFVRHDGGRTKIKIPTSHRSIGDNPIACADIRPILHACLAY